MELDELLSAGDTQSAAAPMKAIAGLDANPDDAARALDLSGTTGVPATSIFGDLPGFERHVRAKATGDLIEMNPHLGAFINQNPLAAEASNDDLGTLDAVSQKLSALPFRDRGSIHDAAFQAFGDLPGLPSEPIGSVLARTLQNPIAGLFELGPSPAEAAAEPKPITTKDLIFSPEARAKFFHALKAYPAHFIEGIEEQLALPGKVAAGQVDLSTEEGMNSAIGLGVTVALGRLNKLPATARTAGMTAVPWLGDTSVAQLGGRARLLVTRTFAKDLADQAELSAQGATDTATPHPQADAIRTASRVAEPYLNSGREPPAGLDPLIDRIKSAANSEDLTAINEAADAARGSTTLARAPDLFATFVRQHVGEDTIGIAPEAIERLYGAKPITSRDGPLGWYPQLEHELAAAKQLGTDVKVPLADWLAKTSPEVRDSLADDIRTRPENITASEAARAPGEPPPLPIPAWTAGEYLQLARTVTMRRTLTAPGRNIPEAINDLYARWSRGDIAGVPSHVRRIFEDAARRDPYGAMLQSGGAAVAAASSTQAAQLQGFDSRLVRHHSVDEYLAASNRALRRGDLEQAATARQWARAAQGLRGDISSLNDFVLRYSGRVPDDIDPAYVPYIRQILMQAKRGTGPFELPSKSLADFIREKAAEHQPIPIPDFLLNPRWSKSIPSMETGEFKAVSSALIALEHSARAEGVLPAPGGVGTVPFADAKAQLISRLRTFPEKVYDVNDKRPIDVIPGVATLRQLGAAHLKIEALFRRWDRADPNGPWTKLVIHPLIAADNHLDAVVKSFAVRMPEVPKRGVVANTIFRDASGRLLPFDRSNLLSVMLNAADPERLAQLAKDYATTPEAIRGWIARTATAEDDGFASRVHALFAEAKTELDAGVRDATGLTPSGVGTGWYPLISHPETGKVWLSLDQMPIRLRQMLHDSVMTPSIRNAGKVFRDPQIREAIRTHYGKEYVDLLNTFLKDVAGRVVTDDRLMAQLGAGLDAVRRNLTTSEIGLNAGTVLKHGTTAFVNSMQEVGLANFFRELATLGKGAEGETNWAFAHRMSEEIQRRHSNYEDFSSGGPHGLTSTFRDTIARWGTAPVAVADKLSAVPTWLARYRTEMAAGASESEAVRLADMSVRNAHGSFAITSKPAIMRQGPAAKWFTSLFGFWNHILNQQFEAAWRAGDMARGVPGARDLAAVKRTAGLTLSVGLLPGIIHELYAGELLAHDKSAGQKIRDVLLSDVLGPWILARDLLYTFSTGRDPSGGQVASAMKSLTDFPRDVVTAFQGHGGRPLAGKMIRHGAELAGLFTGFPQAIGTAGQFAVNTGRGIEHPRGPWDWLRGLRFGTIHPRG